MTNVDIQQGLEQDARLVEERISNKMDKKAIKEVGIKFGDFIKGHDITQASAAKALGLSAARLNQFCKGKYTCASEEMAKKAASYMNTVAAQRRTQLDNPGFVETEVARRIFRAIKMAESFSNSNEAKCAVVVGDSGHGKTLCLSTYASMHGCLYVALDDGMTSKDIFSEIAKVMNQIERTRININTSLRGIIRQLVDVLQTRVMTIILDEASGLTVKQINQLRQIIMIRAKRTLIVSGNNQLLSTINQDSARYGKESLDQFYGRMTALVDLDKLAATNGRGGGSQLYMASDIRKLYEQLGLKLSRDAVKTFLKICQTPQTSRVRTCSLIITALCKVRSIREGRQEINAAVIFQAIEELDLPSKIRLPFTWNDIHEECQSELQQLSQTA